MKRAVVFNLGCKVNQYECDALEGGLRAMGYETREELVPADLYIVNTCAVTAEAERKSRQIIARIKKLNPSAYIMISGCASQKNKDFYIGKGIPFVSGVGGKDGILQNIGKTYQGDFSLDKEYEETGLTPSGSRTRAYIKIQDGCDNFCSYCIIPYLRGRSRSRSVLNSVNEIRELSKSVNEIVITGINLSRYGRERGESLAGLIRELKDIDTRIRLGSFYVEGIDEELLDALFSLKEFCPHFHLSLQHGDQSVLKAMNRKYTPEEYLKKVGLIRSYDKNAAITTDIIVGFPAETGEAYDNLIEFIKKAAFSDIHIFPFSAREGTAAAKMKPLDPQIIKDRRLTLEKIRDELREDYLNKMLVIPQTVLFETKSGDLYEGYSEYYIRIYAGTGLKKAVVIPTELYKDGLKARITQKEK